MAIIRYLIGAGASFGTRNKEQRKFSTRELTNNGILAGGGSCSDITTGLPIVSEIPERLHYFYSMVLGRKNALGGQNPSNTKYDYLMQDMKWLYENSLKHASIDTFAKKLYLQKNKKDLLRLKKALVIFLSYEQKINPIDSRYDSFLASILGRDVYDFPQNISIISWNYDFQLELAYNEYVDANDIYELGELLKVTDKISDQRDEFPADKINGFQLLKLNGTVNFKGSDDFFKYNNSEYLDYLAGIYPTIKEDDICLSFAWERMGEKFLDRINECVRDTEILVVIGYSFPFFNRSVDKHLLNEMKQLKKIYIQDANPDKVKIGLEAALPDRMIDNLPIVPLLTDKKQFFLPPELS